MNSERLTAHYQRLHGIEEGTVYDPYVHDDVPAMAFGTLESENEGQHLRPELDLGFLKTEVV